MVYTEMGCEQFQKKSLSSCPLHLCNTFLPSPFPVLMASHRYAAMDDGLQTMQYHCIPSHGDVVLTVVHMNQEMTVNTNLAIFESLLDFED
jgi:hypothetical protein